jgi:hypothetical protein
VAPAFRSVSTTTFSGSASLVMSAPAGVQDGDLLLFFGGAETAARYWNRPTGWNFVTGTGIDANGHLDESADSSAQVQWKVASGEPSSWTFTPAAGTPTGAAAVCAYSGVDTATPINVAAAGAVTTAGTAFATPSITPTVSGCLLVGFWTTDETVASSWTPPGTMAERFDVQEASFFESLSAADELYNSTAAVTRTATLATSDTGTAWLIALAPAAAAGDPFPAGYLPPFALGRFTPLRM